ncbi:TPA: VWA domain-containing protein [Candidatus Woesearchaeota archaeon]|nr:VWA domain-containing protein [Candidatus Woesearchaeota archaeon]HII69576.1 VWA domain-containing protein [Candidatus Woesearchaeota archaeon]
MQLIFDNPGYLWSLLGIPLLILIHLKSLWVTRGKALQFANYEAIRRIVGDSPMHSLLSGWLSHKHILSLLVRSAILSLLILALAGTTMMYEGNASDADYVLAIDASSSMLADDFTPNRFEAAKAAATAFLDSLHADARAGVVSFSGTAFVEQKLTPDLSRVREAIASITFSQHGTDLAQAIVTSANLFSDTTKQKAIILITDGQSNVGLPVADGISYAIAEKVVVYTIGIGTAEGGSFLGLNITSKIDDAELMQIAQETGGTFTQAADADALFAAYTSIGTASRRTIFVDCTLMFVVIALVLLFIEWGILHHRTRIIE